MAAVSVLIPTFDRGAALAATLTSLCFQRQFDFDVVIADQSSVDVRQANAPVAAALDLLATRGVHVRVLRNLPRRGMAQQRQFLLEHASAPLGLFIDDDVILEPFVIDMLAGVIENERCGFVGSPVIGLSYRDDVRPDEQHMEILEGPVEPETVTPDDPRWQRHKLHNAANPWHVQQALRADPANPVRYRVAWVGGCVMYDVEKLRTVGGFGFWTELPRRHCGEDVLAQLRVAARFGGCGVLPSGAYHQELPTTVTDRRIDAPYHLPVEPAVNPTETEHVRNTAR